MSTRPPVFVHLHPSHLPAGCLAGSTAVVIDVLRATTVMIHALAAGCRAIIPCLEIEEALAIHKSFPQGHAFLGGEREGRPIDGFDLGNSPADYTAEICKGRTLVMTTTNGTRAIQKCCDAEKVYVVGFVNLADEFLSVDHGFRATGILCRLWAVRPFQTISVRLWFARVLCI